MKNSKSIVWGIVLVVVGLILTLNALDIVNVNFFFDGWWTLFIIIPCAIGLFTDEDKTGQIIGLIIGILLLLGCQKIINFDLLWKLIFPIVILVVGLSLIFKNAFNKELSDEIKKLNKKVNKDGDTIAIFSGQEVDLEGETFKGKNLCAVFGGIDLDLRKAIIKEDVIINATSVFGGIDIYVPDDVKIVVKSSSVFGGVDNHKKNKNKDKGPTIYVNAACIFGGIDIK